MQTYTSFLDQKEINQIFKATKEIAIYKISRYQDWIKEGIKIALKIKMFTEEEIGQMEKILKEEVKEWTQKIIEIINEEVEKKYMQKQHPYPLTDFQISSKSAFNMTDNAFKKDLFNSRIIEGIGMLMKVINEKRIHKEII